MKTFSKESLKQELREIANAGWHRSHRDTTRARNDGAAGNLLESLLGIEENNLPLPNANEWELKVQRRTTSSPVTLKHIEPSPRSMRFIPRVLLPLYGWEHAGAGTSYPATEMSFRMTMNAGSHTDRGFKIEVELERIRVAFDSRRVDPRHRSWLDSVKSRVGHLEDLDPAPYWGFDDLRRVMSAKLHNAFFVIADVDIRGGHEYFKYSRAEMLSGFSLEGFLDSLAVGEAFVEFDARTGHNHGSKFRVKASALPKLYAAREVIFDL